MAPGDLLLVLVGLGVVLAGIGFAIVAGKIAARLLYAASAHEGPDERP